MAKSTTRTRRPAATPTEPDIRDGAENETGTATAVETAPAPTPSPEMIRRCAATGFAMQAKKKDDVDANKIEDHTKTDGEAG